MRAQAEFVGQDMYNTWAYTRIIPLHEIEFVLNFADADGNRIEPTAMGLPADIPQDVRHLITFKAVNANQTEMTVTEFGYTSDQVFDMSKAGLEQCLDKMGASFVTA
jgi:activator of Hsp90 ATPase-like protein